MKNSKPTFIFPKGAKFCTKEILVKSVKLDDIIYIDRGVKAQITDIIDNDAEIIFQFNYDGGESGIIIADPYDTVIKVYIKKLQVPPIKTKKPKTNYSKTNCGNCSESFKINARACTCCNEDLDMHNPLSKISKFKMEKTTFPISEKVMLEILDTQDKNGFECIGGLPCMVMTDHIDRLIFRKKSDDFIKSRAK